MPVPPVSRRHFLKTASVASASALAFPALLRAKAGSPNERLNVACIGVGGRGREAVRGVKGENLVAFCDVDDERAAEIYAEFPNVPHFRDYRVMFDRLGREIDAVTISTPDHMHFPIAMAAIALGKHVFVEKPLTHTIWEARQLAAAARAKKVATQMGNQGHANEGTRLVKEWVDAGVVGEVREIHSWTNRPIWPQGVRAPDHSKAIPVTPATLDWDLWLGVAAARPYDPAYVPFTWRGYWDFGTGALGDMGCHIMDSAYWALGLGAPVAVEAVSGGANDLSPPTSSVITYDFAARGGQPALRWTWYDGGLKPALPDYFEAGRQLPDNGSLIVGAKATVLTSTYSESVRLVPEAKMRELGRAPVPKTLPRIEGTHFDEWVRACKGGPAAGSNFDYSGPFTELVLLSNVAVRARRRIEWDAAALQVTNLPEANRYLTKEYRPGHGV